MKKTVLKKLLLALPALLLAVMFASSCSKEIPLNPPTSVSIENTPSGPLAVGDTYQLSVKVLPLDADEHTVEYKSSNSAVATVDGNGKITVEGDGTTTITVFIKEIPTVKAEFVLTVSTPKPPTSISVENIPSEPLSTIGGVYQLSVKVLPMDATGYTLEYKSSLPTVATVDNEGKIKVVGGGTTTITVFVKEIPTVKAEFVLTVRPVYFAPQNTKFRKVAYFPSYRDIASIPDSKLQMLDVACYAFASIKADYTLTVEQPAKLAALAERCRNLGVKILISFNGTHATFAQMVSSAENRAKFIQSLKNIVETYNLDGVDSDWEYPKVDDNSDKGNTALMKEISSWLHDPAVDKLFTMAIASGRYTGGVVKAIEDECFQYVDWFNVMAYGDQSTTDPSVNHSPFSLLQAGYKYWVETRGMPKYKFVGGLPAYGRASGITQTGTPLAYSVILEQGGNPDENSAMVTSPNYQGGTVPYLIQYNGRPLIRQKTRYCIDQKLGGIMFWEAGQDSENEFSLIKAAHGEIGNYSDIL